MAVIGGSGLKAATLLLPSRKVRGVETGDQHKVSALSVDYSASSAANVLNITGSGIWEFGMLVGKTSATYAATIKVTIDGTIVLNDGRTGENLYTSAAIQVGALNYQNGTADRMMAYGSVPFNTSLVVTITADDDCEYWYNYYLT